MNEFHFNPERLKASSPMIFAVAARERGFEVMRRRLCSLAEQMEYETFYDYSGFREGSIIRVRDCARVFRNLLSKRSEDLTGFSVARAIQDVARNRARPDLTPAFYADLCHLILGLQGLGPGKAPADQELEVSRLKGREAAWERSAQLDSLWKRIEERIKAYPHGLLDQVIEQRKTRVKKISDFLNASKEDWDNWDWQIQNVIKDEKTLSQLLVLSEVEKEAVKEACHEKIPFGITPYYLSLMDEKSTPYDRAVRKQVIPPMSYVKETTASREKGVYEMDFMLEGDTSPVDLITRRYPTIVIFKPYNTCPQICVYCQRNWEIDGVLASTAMATSEQIEEAIAWIKNHPAIHEVLLTGGDPLTLPDAKIQEIMERIAQIPSIERIRIGTRTPVTLPMRITEDISALLGQFQIPGKREIVMVTHVQHAYEITPQLLTAIQRIRKQGISVCNQLVYTFWNSRRFEAAALRRILRLAGIIPYYTFNAKGKGETRDYRIPVARLLQEQKEEARLLSGMVRTDEAVYNVPGMGKNYLRAWQHRDILSILPDGSRVYEYHPWEKNISGTTPLETFITHDVPILEYLKRLSDLGEDVIEYQTIWYYF
jgi:lysine 2,3-aminomutase